MLFAQHFYCNYLFLIKFSKNCTVAPKFLCVVCGMIDYAYQRPDGVYVISIVVLRP